MGDKNGCFFVWSIGGSCVILVKKGVMVDIVYIASMSTVYVGIYYKYH